MAAETFIGYAARSYQVIKSEIIELMKVDIPEITDYNSSNIFIRQIEMFAGVMQMLHRYVDYIALEVYLVTLRKFENAIKIAKQYGYRAKGAAPASVVLTFTANSPVVGDQIIPAFTIVETADGTRFETIEDVTILNGNTQVDATAFQRVQVTHPTQISDGTANQTFPLVFNVVDSSIQTSVDAFIYDSVETFLFSNATSTDFIAGLNSDALMEVGFGDGQNGVIPIVGASVVISYYLTKGDEGNVSASSINSIVSAVPVPMTVTNTDTANGGADQETLDNLRKTIALFNRTKDRAVTDDDFRDVAEQVPAVARASVAHECGAPVFVYVAPKSGGISPPTLLLEVAEYLDARKVEIDVVVQSIGIVEFVLSLQIRVLPNFYSLDVRNAVLANLIQFFDIENQEANSTIRYSDIIEVVENTIGVQNSQFTTPIGVIPYARPVQVATDPLEWTRITNAASTSTLFWKVIFTSATDYDLSNSIAEDGVYTPVLSSSVNVPQSIVEIDFEVLPSLTAYVAAQEYRFVTYPYFNLLTDALVMQEPSVVGSSEAQITITTIGGLA